MADENNKLDSKTISLKLFKVEEYFSWAPHAEIAFKLHKCWDIVNGTELDPTPPPNTDDTPAAITAELQSKIDSWEHRRNLAQEAVFKSLSSSEMAKIYDVKHDLILSLLFKLFNQFCFSGCGSQLVQEIYEGRVD